MKVKSRPKLQLHMLVNCELNKKKCPNAYWIIEVKIGDMMLATCFLTI